MLQETILWQEIHQQPAVIDTLLSQQAVVIRQLAAAIQASNIRSVVIAARGSSDNAARYAQYVLGIRHQMLVTLATPSLISIYDQTPYLTDSLVLGISQSGASPDLISVLTEAKRQRALTAVITNHPDSPLAELGDFVIDLCAGVEKAVAATKTYTAQLTVIALLSVALAGEKMTVLHQLPSAVEQTLQQHVSMTTPAIAQTALTPAVVIGRGFNYATAFEIALKIKELAYLPVQAYSSADFLHGPLALVEPGFLLLLIAPNGRLNVELQHFSQKMRQLGAEMAIITDMEGMLINSAQRMFLPVTVPEWLSPITAVIPGQLLALTLTYKRGLDLDNPRTIQKVTYTV